MKRPGAILSLNGEGGRRKDGVLFQSRAGNTSLRDVLNEAIERGYRLDNADLAGVDAHGLNLSGARMNGADLTDANLTGADCNYTSFKGANLTGAKLDHAKAGWADFRKVVGVPSATGIKTNRLTRW